MKGFALIEIMVSIAISSILSLSLFALLSQVQKSQLFVEQTIATNRTLVTVYERFSTDLTGMFWPQFLLEDHKTKSEQVKIDKIIFSKNARTNDVEHLKFFSFITSNPLQVYNESKPRVARVIYSVEIDSENKNSFILYRQESQNLDYNHALKDAPKYQLASGIRDLKFTYFYQDQDQQIKKQELDQNQEQDLKQQEMGVPNYVQIKLSLFKNSNKQDYQDYEFWFAILKPEKTEQNVDQFSQKKA